MGVIVYSREGSFKYSGARNWVVDDYGRLHLVGPKGNLGSFNESSWDSVHEIDDNTPSSDFKLP